MDFRLVIGAVTIIWVIDCSSADPGCPNATVADGAPVNAYADITLVDAPDRVLAEPDVPTPDSLELDGGAAQDVVVQPALH